MTLDGESVRVRRDHTVRVSLRNSLSRKSPRE
jgi:hypothetical protein